MANLQQGAALFGRGDHPVSLYQCSGDRLLDQNMNAGIEKDTCDFSVRFSWHGQAYGVNLADEVAPVSSPPDVAASCNVARGLLIDITNGNELNQTFSGKVCMDTRVLAA